MTVYLVCVIDSSATLKVVSRHYFKDEVKLQPGQILVEGLER